MKPRQQFIKDVYIIESFARELGIVKNADGSFTQKLKDTIISVVPDDAKQEPTIKKVLGFLSPAIFGAIFGVFGGTWLRIIITIGTAVFGINIYDIGKAIISALSSKTELSVDDISSTSTSIIESLLSDPSNEKIESKLKSLGHNLYGQEEMLKLGFTNYRLKKVAGVLSRGFFASFLSKVFSIIIQVFLVSAGVAIIGSVFKGLTQSDGDKNNTKTYNVVHSSQKKFPVSKNYSARNQSSPWIIQEYPSNIRDMLVSWTKEIYPDVDKHMDALEDSNVFNSIVYYLENYNAGTTAQIVYIPKELTNKKMVVDQFIDDVADNIK